MPQAGHVNGTPVGAERLTPHELAAKRPVSPTHRETSAEEGKPMIQTLAQVAVAALAATAVVQGLYWLVKPGD